MVCPSGSSFHCFRTGSHAGCAVCVVGVGVAGWNTVAAGLDGARTLLGPEKTSAGWWVFLWWTILGLAGLTHWVPVCVRVSGVVAVVGSGCGCVLSVA
jgi:hypothetical protein